MEKNLFQKKVLLFIAITLITSMSVLPGAYGSILISPPPNIDGDASDWTLTNSTRFTINGGFVHLMNDTNNLYVLIDVTSDTSDDPPPPPDNDYFMLAFDVNLNQVKDNDVDMKFSTVQDTLDPCYQYAAGSCCWTGCNVDPSQFSLARGFGISVNSSTPHRIWELKILRSSINATGFNSPLRFAVRLGSLGTPAFLADTPPGFYSDFSVAFLTDQMDKAPNLIDATKWVNLELIRRAENGALHSAVRSYGSALSNNLQIKDPSGVDEIQANVTVNDIINSNSARTHARIGGFFFSDGTGDYYAEAYIGRDFTGGLQASCFAVRCLDGLQCTSSDNFQSCSGTPVNSGQSYALKIVYDYIEPQNNFSFELDGHPLGYLPVPSPLGLPSVPFKTIGTRVYGPLGPGETGYVDAKFENVLLMTVPTPISDSNGMIDGNTWIGNTLGGSTLEFVREQISDGAFRLALRSLGSFANNGLNLVDGKNVVELQADMTVETLTNNPTNDPNMTDPATPMAGLHGNFYNANVSGGSGIPGDQTDDIKAYAGIRLGVPSGPYSGQPVAFYNIVRCIKPSGSPISNCNIYTGNPTTDEIQRLYYYEDPKTIGSDLVGKPHRVSIRYDNTSNTFTFGFDGRLTTPGPSSPGWVVPPPLPTNHALPNAVLKGPHTRVAFFGGPTGEGYVSAKFENIATVVDTDGDGMPDSTDNCPTVSNPVVADWVDYLGQHHYDTQPDFNLNNVGDACDLCPKVPGTDGGPCPASVGFLIASAAGTSINVTVTYRGAAAYLVPPDCNNVIFNSDPPIPQNCRRIPPYTLTVFEDPNKLGYGSPGGDWKLTQPNTSWTINCNLLDIFNEAALKAASALGPVTITPVYTFFDTDRGLDPTGTCVNKDQGDVCVDISQYNLFQGAIPAQQPVSVVIPLDSLSIDIKPYTVPNSINLKKEGSIPVAIFSIPTRTPPFDAKTIDVSSLVLTQNGTPGSAVVVKNKGRYQFSYADINGDGVLDLVVHFDIHGLTGLKTGQACVNGSTSDGQSFEGCDLVTVVGK